MARQGKTLKNATFRVPRSVWQRAKKRAVDEDRSLNDVVVDALESYAGVTANPGVRMLADAERFLTLRGRAEPGPHPSKDALHEREGA